MLYIASQGYVVEPGGQLAGQVDVPFEAIIVQPPHLALLAVGNLLAAHIEPTLVEQAGKTQMQRTGSLLGSKIDFRTIPKITRKTLVIGMQDTLGLRI